MNRPKITHETQDRWGFVQDVVLPVYEDPDGPGDSVMYAPPSRVLTVKVVGERVFIAIRKYEETNDTTTMTTLHEEMLSAEALLNALVIQMGIEHVQGLLRRTESWPKPDGAA